METNTSPATGENSSASEPKGYLFIAPPGDATFEERLLAVEKMKANLIAEGRTRLEEIGVQRRRLDAEEAHLREFLGLDKGPAPPPVPEKKLKAPRGSVRGPVEAFYKANVGVRTEEGVQVAYSTSAVAKETGLDLDQVQGSAAKLAKDGVLERTGKSVYRWKAQAA